MASLLSTLLNASPVPLTSRGGSLLGLPASADPQLSQMEATSTLFSIIDLISTAVATPDWHLYIKAQGDQPEEERTEVTSHPALVVWSRPNSHYTQDEFIEAIQQHYELTGEFWWVVERRSAGQITGITDLWPIRPDRMKPVPHPQEFISGYTYTIGDDKIPLGLDQVVFEKRQNPQNPWRGLSPINSLISDINAERHAARWNSVFFQNGAEPGGIIELGMDNVMDDDEFDRLRTHWYAQHRGTSNAHRVAIMEMGTWKDRKLTHRDMEFSQLRQVSQEQMMTAYRISKAMLGRVEDVNRANSEAQQDIFDKQILIPRLERLKKVLNQKFLPLFGSMGQGLEFDYDDPSQENALEVRQNLRTAVLGVVSLVNAGFEPEAALAAFDLPEIPFIGKPETGTATPQNPDNLPEDEQ